MTTPYDGFIIGAGHNGMILQAYLGKAGMKVLSIERKAVTGGVLSTLEDPRHPGFLHNTHAFFQRAITAMPWYCLFFFSVAVVVMQCVDLGGRCFFFFFLW